MSPSSPVIGKHGPTHKGRFKFMTGTQGVGREGRWGCLATCPFPFPDDLLALWFLQNSYPDPSPSAADHPPISPAKGAPEKPLKAIQPYPAPTPWLRSRRAFLPQGHGPCSSRPCRENPPPTFRPLFQGPKSRDDPHSQHLHPHPSPLLSPASITCGITPLLSSPTSGT